MLKKYFFLLILLFFAISNAFAIEWQTPVKGEYPFTGANIITLPIPDEIKNSSKHEQSKYLEDLYKTLYIIELESGFIINNKYRNPHEPKIYYDNNLNVFAGMNNGDIDAVSYSFFKRKVRFVKFCDFELKKCGLYDTHKNLYTGLEYDQIMASYSGTPILIKDDKKIYIQPFKNIGASTFLGITRSLETLGYIILSPFIFFLI